MTRAPFRLEPIDGLPGRWRVVRTKTEQEIARDVERLASELLAEVREEHPSMTDEQLEDQWRLLCGHFGF